MGNNLILIGFMGTGKDTVGRELSRRTGMPLLSLDHFLELNQGASIAEIFRRRGETFFRQKERLALRGIHDLNRTVIATGGGTILDPRNRQLMKSMGRIVHLAASRTVIEQRLRGDLTRPLIKNRRRLRNIFEARRHCYDFAELAVDTSRLSPAQAARIIMRRLGFSADNISRADQVLEIRSCRRSYPVFIGYGILSRLTTRALALGSTRRGVLLTNPLVGALYLDRVQKMFQALGINLVPLIIPDGEKEKNLGRAAAIYDFLLKQKCSRCDLLVALGGGVITDLAGLIAATFKRGMRLVHVPTTLLSQVDAALGGKTGINHQEGKNVIGVFYPASAVICDTRLIASLPEREFIGGLAEVVKYGFVADASFFLELERNARLILDREPDTITRIVVRCAQLKQAIVENDEFEEKGMRETLNFGHTVGHALETAMNYRGITHGAAVAIGMAEEARQAVRRNFLAKKDHQRLVCLLKRFGLPVCLPAGFDWPVIRPIMRQDKKTRGATVLIPRPIRIGRVIVKEEPCNNFM